MDIINYLRRRKALFLLLFLSSCSSSSPWAVSHLKGSGKQFDSARLSYPLRDKVNGVAVEMIYTQNKIRTYLEVHSQKIPPYQGHEKEALVILKTQETTHRAIGHRHEGGQRVSLPPDLQHLLIESLLQGHEVTLQLQGYSTTLSPEEFQSNYEALSRSPTQLPFQLPFKL